MTDAVPTRRADWARMGRETGRTLRSPAYAAVALAATLAVLAATVAVLNWRLVADFVLGGGLPVSERLLLFAALFPFVNLAYGTLESLLLTVVAVAVGANAAVAVRHLRVAGASPGATGSGAVGLAAGVLGAGCPTCGQALLVGVLSMAGATGALGALPLGGTELLVVALLPVAVSLHWLARGLRTAREGCSV